MSELYSFYCLPEGLPNPNISLFKICSGHTYISFAMVYADHLCYCDGVATTSARADAGGGGGGGGGSGG